MKKVLLITLAISCSAIVNAQKSPSHGRDKTPANRMLNFSKKATITNEPVSNIAPYKDINTATLKIIGTSANGNTALSGKKITADQQTKTILYGYRGGGAWGGTSSDIYMKFSTNYGTTFDSVIYVDANAKRYPGTTLFRNGSDLFVVAAGPITDNTNWIANYIYSAKLDGTLASSQIVNYPAPSTVIGSYYWNDCLKALDNGEFYLLGEKNGPATTYTHISYDIIKYQWNATNNKFDSVSLHAFTPLLSKTMAPVQPSGMAWNDAGTIGYFWVNAEDSLVRPNLGTEPLVWKTIDHGSTWTQMSIYDYSQIQEFKNWVWPTLADTSVLRPMFNYGYTTSDQLLPGTVDANGNLHLIVTVNGGYSTDPDSLSYTYTNEPIKLFDLYTTSTGWDAKYIDTLTSTVDDGTAAAMGAWTMDHRIHIGKTSDGAKIFAMWTDSDPASAPTNIVPNFKAWGRDINSGYQTPSKNFSINQGDDGAYLYMNATDIVLDNGSAYVMPVINIDNQQNDPGANPVNHIYASPLEFVYSDFSNSINEVNSNISSISQNYPNPFNGTTTLNVSLVKSADLSVIVTNIVGQQVSEIQMGTVSAGSHTVTIDAGKLTSGIYFYTIKAGESKVTQKMIVQ